MKILFLSQWFPYPHNNGSKIRIFNLLRGLAEAGHRITLVSFSDQPMAEVDSPALKIYCDEIHCLPWRSFNPRSWRALTGFVSDRPRSVIGTFSPEMLRLIEKVLSAGGYSLVIASGLEMAGYAAAFRGLPAILEELQLGVLYEQYAQQKITLRRWRHGMTWQKQCHYIASLLRHFRFCTVVSQEERAVFSQAFSAYLDVRVLPNCVHLQDYGGIQPSPDPLSLVFAGSLTYSPNEEAMLWFIREVFPSIKQSSPEVHLTITGDPGGRSFPQAEGIRIAGQLDDIRPTLASAWVSLAPIWTGGGTRLKILEAMALRTPVVATSKGAEGLEVTQGKDILLANTPEGFAQAVVRLLQHTELRQQLAANAYDLVCRKYNWPVVMPDFLSLVEAAAAE